MEIAAFIGLVIMGLILFFLIVLLNSIGPTNAPWISEHNEPDPNCEDCNGSGLLNEGDDHLETYCHCTDRIYF